MDIVNEKVADKPEKQERSWAGAAVEAITPWGGSRSSTPRPAPPAGTVGGSGLKNQHGGYHSTHQWGLSSKRYPSDCPALEARWFYAVDVCVIFPDPFCSLIISTGPQKKTQSSRQS